MSDILHKATAGAIGVGLAAMLGIAAPAGAGTVPESTDPIKIAINEWTGQHITAHVAGVRYPVSCPPWPEMVSLTC